MFYRYDYLTIANDIGDEFGKYCGTKSGKEILVTGDSARLTFHSDFIIPKRGFAVFFSFVGK